MLLHGANFSRRGGDAGRILVSGISGYDITFYARHLEESTFWQVRMPCR